MSFFRRFGLIILVLFAFVEGLLLTVVSCSSDFINKKDTEQIHLTITEKYKGISKVQISKRSTEHSRNFTSYFQGQYSRSCKRCGLINSKSRNFLIVNGTFVDPPYKYPWMVGLEINSKKKFGYQIFRISCGGAIISEYYILTAAHCLLKSDSEESANSTEYMNPEDVSIHFLTNTYSLRKGPKVQKLIPHPEYIRRPKKNDIALIKLKTRIMCDMYKKPICLPHPSLKVPNGIVVTTAGWGKTENEVLVQRLKEISISKVNIEKCNIYPFVREAKEDKYCFEGSEGSPCIGDSGGPAFYEKNGKNFIIGITSGGDHTCKAGHPFYYTAVPMFAKWIKQVMGSPFHRSIYL